MGCHASTRSARSPSSRGRARRACGSAPRRSTGVRRGRHQGLEAILRRIRVRRVRELRGGGGGGGGAGRMRINGVTIADTFAEAFTMRVARIVITGRTVKWAREAATKLTGFATSVIGCKCEAGIERELAPP